MEDLSRFKSIVDDYGNSVDAPGQNADKLEKEADGSGADKAAKFAVKAHEIGFSFFDSDIKYTDEIYKQAEKELRPLLEKHNFGSSVENIPMEEEVRAGLFIGRLWSKSIETIRANRKKKEGNKKDDEKPKHNAGEQPHSLSSEERPREESGVNASQFNTAHQ